MMRTTAESFSKTLPEAVAAITSAQRIAVLSHYNPDPDAYGSSCGLARTLHAAGKAVEVINENGAVQKLEFIPGVKSVVPTSGILPELLIVCDCGDIGRVGDSLVPFVKNFPHVINLDHHTSNDFFGSINLVDETASSSSELVVRLITALGLPIPPDAASALFAGLSADTGSFKYSSTSASTFDVAAALVRAGAVPVKVSEHLYSSASLAGVRVHARVMSDLRLYENNTVCVLAVPKSLVDELGASPEDSEGLVEKGRDIEGVRISALLRWVDGIWRVSMRSRNAVWNVSELAQEFGGGGHKVAAAFRWKRSQEELEAALIPRLIDVAKSTVAKGSA
jgi:phosphoesterase RecJ-like protein